MTRVLLDACVIFPTVMREMLLGAADAGLFEPLWSDRIMEEWVRAADRLGDGAIDIARAEAALMRAQFPKALVTPVADDGLWLPDPDDVHVLGAAIAGKADVILTRNLKDFPTRVLATHDILRRDPDGFLIELADAHPQTLARLATQMHAKAERLSGRPQTIRGLLKRTNLPRLSKRLG